jgi:ElaB/YqjD/DUF883 family membrane-anchored ribosome-binding protein
MAQYYGNTDYGAGETGKAGSIRSQIEEKAEAAKDTIARTAGEVEQRTEDALAATKRFVQEQPMVALAGVAVIGLALGALWKLTASRPSSRASDMFERLSEALQPGYDALRRRL